MLGAESKRAWLTVWSENAKTAGGLRAEIVLSLQALPGMSTGGQLIQQTSAFGHSVSFSIPGQGAATAEELSGFAAWAIQEHDLARASLITSGVPIPTDAQILTELLFRCQPCREATSSYLNLRA